MKKLTYQCDDCEDTEVWEEALKEGFHCECGGHLELIIKDNYLEPENFSLCLICQNRDTDECIDCKRA